MTDEQIKALVINTLNALDVCRDRLPSPGDISLVESLCREMVAEGLERATAGLKLDNTKLHWALKELGPTATNAEAYVNAAVEQVIWCREEAARLKEKT